MSDGHLSADEIFEDDDVIVDAAAERPKKKLAFRVELGFPFGSKKY